MRIHSFGDPEVLRADEVEFSGVKAASVNAVDFKIRNGKYPP
jgi:NADPH:quinone reductase-like Zn-dependent oxidoreductase